MASGIAKWIRVEPLVAVVLWGGIYPGAKLGLQEIPALSFTYLRLILAAIVLAAASGHGRSGWAWSLRGPALRAGAAQAAFQLLLIAGLARTTAGASAILLAASRAVFAHADFRLRDHLQRTRFARSDLQLEIDRAGLA